jgi:hypothetical protein
MTDVPVGLQGLECLAPRGAPADSASCWWLYACMHVISRASSGRAAASLSSSTSALRDAAIHQDSQRPRLTCTRDCTDAAEELKLCRPNEAWPKRKSIVVLSFLFPRATAAAGVQMVVTGCLLTMMMELDDNAGRLSASFVSQLPLLH